MSALREFVDKYFSNKAPAAKASAADKAPAADKPSRPPTKQEAAILEDRRQLLKKARAAWEVVKAKAEANLEKVKEGARREYMADAVQFPKVVKGIKDIDGILDGLDDDLRDTLDEYVATPVKNQAKLSQLKADAYAIVERYYKYVANNALLKAVDHKEFADVTVHAPVMQALGALKKALS
jgi:hypothetical protein